ncbi:hypothetical protein PGQ11_011472 [Apiospora arundinis]|uniref:Protection of telomeres protein 1 n=1 Tax=Apiospora arundinis TaxID=335852 RepID=A0ABR2I0R5_9PEZI
MASREAPSSAPRSVSANRPLPPGFKSVQDILGGGSVVKGTFINMIGLVREVRLPIATRGLDWKCVITIFDKSTEDEDAVQHGITGLEVHLFYPQKLMPKVGFRDVVLLKAAKVQDYRSELSLLSNQRTEIYVYSASAIPMPPKSAKGALKPPVGSSTKQPEDKEHEYVSWMYHALDKDSLPEADVFEQQANTSLNIKEKFSLLKDVGDGGFYDLIVEIVKDPYDLVDRVTLWVTDYTENKYFFHHSWDPSNADSGRDGDPYGYTSGFGNPTTKGWPGPYGKQCIQLTCFEPHASHLRSHVRAGKWIRLRNLQIKFGRNGGNLEGYLREDRAYPSRLGFEVLDLSAFSEDGDPRAKDAVRRKLEYSRKLKQQKADFANREDISAVGVKRKGNGESAARLNSRQKRKILRAQRDQQIEKEQAQKAESLGLNKQVRCESEDQPVSSLSRVLNDVSWKRSRENGEEDLALPFTNIKFRANVRVIDFRPRRLEDFSVGRRATEFDCLDDYDGDLESDSDGQSETLDKFAAPKTWEWRFALQLEDASPKAKGEKAEQVWALVDNTEAQQLLNLDAVDLQANPQGLSQLRETLFKLWGNLEECKRQEFDATLESSIQRVNVLEPPPDSSDNEVEQDGPKLAGHRTLAKVSNKPFTCCLQQYGLEIDESDPTKCDAGVGKRYQRLHKIFGTTVR